LARAAGKIRTRVVDARRDEIFMDYLSSVNAIYPRPIAMRIQSAIGLILHPRRGSDAVDLQNCHNARHGDSIKFTRQRETNYFVRVCVRADKPAENTNC